jgi:short-subunit dehydrogenase
MFKKNIVVITGATNGIGQIAAIKLAKLGVRLVLTSRSKKSCRGN